MPTGHDFASENRPHHPAEKGPSSQNSQKSPKRTTQATISRAKIDPTILQKRVPGNQSSQKSPKRTTQATISRAKIDPIILQKRVTSSQNSQKSSKRTTQATISRTKTDPTILDHFEPNQPPRRGWLTGKNDCGTKSPYAPYLSEGVAERRL